jgi:arginine/glutamate-rich protein 1
MLNEITLTVIVIRRQLEAELNLLEEETTRRLEESIRKNVEEKLNSEEVQSEIERRIEEGQKKLFDDVVAQLLKEKEAALVEERRKEVRSLNSH